MAFNTINILISYLLIYNHGLIFSLAADDAANLTSLAFKRDTAGFINIGCGMVGGPQYYKDNGLYYSSDIGFINTGKSMDVQMEYQFSHWSMYNAVRSFPDGSRNCYTLRSRPSQGKKSHYLIRALFQYGNYDGLNRIPQFDLYIGVNHWVTIQPTSVNKKFFYEIIYAPPEDLIYVCLVNTGSGTPFISGLELRPLNNSIYKSATGALWLSTHLSAGFLVTTDADIHNYSFKDDPYDRQWVPVKKSITSWDSLSSNASMNFSFTDAYELPPSILKKAAIPKHGGGSLMFDYNYTLTGSFQVYWHFAEIQKLAINDSREFTISMTGNFESGKISPDYGRPITVVSPLTKFNESHLHFTIRKTSKSTLPPILNALEIYGVLDLPTTATYPKDVDAILNMKMNYTLPKDWQGDPCLPIAPWDGLNCSNSVDNHPPRIVSLNLALSGLTGDIPHSLSALTSLVYLNLSHNGLTGVIPDFLAEFPSLRTIDLTSNNLVGRVPKALSKKIEDGSLNLSLEGNPGLCSSNSCKKKNSKKIVVILLVAVSLIFIFVAIGVFYKYKQKKQGVTAKNVVSSSIQYESRAFSYFEVLKMTNNFQKVIGKGGSGIVYHGCLQDGTPVAVKMLTPSSKLSLKLFRTEAQLLTRVHHRNLVSLIGYYEEGTTMALIYEHVINGNLQQHLSEKNGKVLSWKQRLQIAIDAAQGLEYLHNGCKPPIVHRDMKTSNILLDENLNAKISDFGISRTFSTENTESGLSTDVVGTHGYVDPEYYSTRRPNKKSDVFSFGVVLLELITGKPSIIKYSAQPIHIIAWTVPKLESGDIHEIVDKKLEGHFTTNSAWKALEIAMMCVPSTAIQRPTMNQVLVDLNDCLAIEISQGRTREIDNHGHGYPSIDTDLDNAIADTSIEMGPTAR